MADRITDKQLGIIDLEVLGAIQIKRKPTYLNLKVKKGSKIYQRY